MCNRSCTTDNKENDQKYTTTLGTAFIKWFEWRELILLENLLWLHDLHQKQQEELC